MTAPILTGVTFDVERYLAPLRKAHPAVLIGATEWRGWDVEVTDAEVRILSAPVTGAAVPEHVKAQAGEATPVRMLTVVPRSLCLLTYAVVQERPAAVAMPEPAPPVPIAAVAPVAPLPAVAAQAAPPPTPRKRPLPPGARPDVEPPPSRINVEGPAELPRRVHAVLAEERA